MLQQKNGVGLWVEQILFQYYGFVQNEFLSNQLLEWTATILHVPLWSLLASVGVSVQQKQYDNHTKICFCTFSGYAFMSKVLLSRTNGTLHSCGNHKVGIVWTNSFLLACINELGKLAACYKLLLSVAFLSTISKYSNGPIDKQPKPPCISYHEVIKPWMSDVLGKDGNG